MRMEEKLQMLTKKASFLLEKKPNFAYPVHYHGAVMQFEDGATGSTTRLH
ncbi:hypothetical protein L914_04189 [Phytophthora nicotianae]|nr:hypothetical protein L914_04189 [Phytophthora nicotianae]